MIISGNGIFQHEISEMTLNFRQSIRIICAILTLTILCAGFSSSSDAKKKGYSPPQAAMVVDGYSGKILYSSNADKPRYPASITKVMALYLLFEQIRDGHMTLKTKLKVSAKAASRPPSKLGLKPGSTISVNDAIYALVTKSANDVAAVVAENIAGSEAGFARMMTQRARAIGMTKTTFRNASGLPNSKQVTTARDLITLGRRMRSDFPKLSKVFKTRYFKYGKRKFRNHNKLLFSYSGMEGMKTGFTRASGFNLLASCRRKGKYLIAVVLGGRSGKVRNLRMRRLLDRSWPKAVTLASYKKSKPIAIAGVVNDDTNLPERNPAFHDVDLGPAPDIVEEEIAEIKLAMAEQGTARPVAERKEAKAVSAKALSANTVSANSIIVSPEPSPKPKVAAKQRSIPQAVPQKTALLTPPGPYHVQVGSFLSSKLAEKQLHSVTQKAKSVLLGHDGHTVRGKVKGKSYYRARYSAFSRTKATNTCKALEKLSIDCLVVRAE